MVLILNTWIPVSFLEDNILMVSDQIKFNGDRGRSGRQSTEPYEINDSCFLIRFPLSWFSLQMNVFCNKIYNSLELYLEIYDFRIYLYDLRNKS
jgi:hypothetical protein